MSTMTNLPCRSHFRAAVAVIVLCALAGCVHDRKKDPADVGAASRKHLAAGDYQKALDVYQSALAKYPEDQTVAGEYVRLIEDICGSASRAYEKEEYVRAGRMYRVLLLRFPLPRGIQKKISFDRNFLLSRITAGCSVLSRQGLEQYRGGNLKQAIETWEGILSFDPENEEIRKMLRTATVQRKNLEIQK